MSYNTAGSRNVGVSVVSQVNTVGVDDVDEEKVEELEVLLMVAELDDCEVAEVEAVCVTEETIVDEDDWELELEEAVVPEIVEVLEEVT